MSDFCDEFAPGDGFPACFRGKVFVKRKAFAEVGNAEPDFMIAKPFRPGTGNLFVTLRPEGRFARLTLRDLEPATPNSARESHRLRRRGFRNHRDSDSAASMDQRCCSSNRGYNIVAFLLSS
jgi:hypothetical protein